MTPSGGTLVVEQDQLQPPGQAAEVTEVPGVLHRTARQANHRGALSEPVVGEHRCLMCREHVAVQAGSVATVVGRHLRQ